MNHILSQWLIRVTMLNQDYKEMNSEDEE